MQLTLAQAAGHVEGRLQRLFCVEALDTHRTTATPHYKAMQLSMKLKLAQAASHVGRRLDCSRTTTPDAHSNTTHATQLSINAPRHSSHIIQHQYNIEKPHKAVQQTSMQLTLAQAASHVKGHLQRLLCVEALDTHRTRATPHHKATQLSMQLTLAQAASHVEGHLGLKNTTALVQHITNAVPHNKATQLSMKKTITHAGAGGWPRRRPS
jgi:flagellar basal body rod protein FlgB